MEFGLRRAQGLDGALSASRAAFIGGVTGTSNTLAGKIFHIPVMGTMAHSWVMSFPSELEAFRAYAALYPERTVFLIDTYDTLQSGIKNAIIAGGELVAKGHNFAVRLDSGDMKYLSQKVRGALDDAGFPQAGITVSNELDEEIIEALVRDGAPITSWGVGTHLVTGGRDSSFTGVYKLAAQHRTKDAGLWESVMKFSDNPEKMTNPGVKELWRLYNDAGGMEADIVALAGEILDTSKETVFYHPAVDYRHFAIRPARIEPLLKQRLAAGTPPTKRDPPDRELRTARSVMEAELALLDDTYKRFLNPHIYKVSLTRELKDMKLGFLEQNGARERNLWQI
jgi:nicotinate phosphoribosyltransferase